MEWGERNTGFFVFALTFTNSFADMTKADIVNRVASATGVTKLETEILVDGFFKTISEALADGEHFEIRGFGTFKVKQRKPRIARNPRTGERVNVEPKFVVTFKPGKEMEEKVRRLDKMAKKTVPPAETQLPSAEGNGALVKPVRMVRT